MSTLRLILGDQLDHKISSLIDADLENDSILMCEVNDEATYVKHHKKKIAFIFSAMRHFAKELKRKGYRLNYVKLDDVANDGSFKSEVTRAIENDNYDRIIVTEPGEYRLLSEIESWRFNVPVEILPDDRFLCTHDEFSEWAKNRKQLTMEYFYREMRKKLNLLMNGNQPEGGKWNYDSQNRNRPNPDLTIPPTYKAKPDKITREVLNLVEKQFPDHFGDLEPFHFAVTRKHAKQALDQFIEYRLESFGDYQDAMIQGEPWMFHSHISFYINVGLLNPLECVKAVETSYLNGNVPLNAAEGFIRQIIGWREYIRGVYWLTMPDYEFKNFFNAKRQLPELFWGKKTKMNCMSQCVKETKENAYAHHIQRLMVLGNFSLLAGLDPNAVNEWYLIVYADAFQWVELPNVTGMILFADAGLLASKPYAASGSYINKMSNYCKQCEYKVSKKNGIEACPFNYLYWNFFIRNDAKLRGNQRLGMTYRTLDRMSEEKIQAIIDDSMNFLDRIDVGEII